MKVYLAGPYSSRQLLKGYADELTRVGYTVTASWLDGTHEITDGALGPAKDFTDADARGWATSDLRGVAEADLLVAFTAAVLDIPAGSGTSGGRHIETGYALALSKPVVLVGEPENVFHRLYQVTVVPTWQEALVELAARLVDRERTRDYAMPVEAGTPT